MLNVLLIILQTKPANLETGIPADWMVIRNICVVYCFHLASTCTFTVYAVSCMFAVGNILALRTLFAIVYLYFYLVITLLFAILCKYY